MFDQKKFYYVEEYPTQNGKWGGYRCGAVNVDHKPVQVLAKLDVVIKEDANKEADKIKSINGIPH